MPMQDNVPYKAGLMELLRLSDGVQYVIPAYQRNYTWTANKEVKQLFEDIKVVLSGKNDKHFIGIIIYLEQSNGPYSRERSVIDGQQRLTTIFLSLYAVKELMLERGLQHDATLLEEMYLINRFNETNRFKLKPLVSDDMVYRQIVSGEFDAIEEKKSKVYLNYVYLKKAIADLLDMYSFNDILQALDKMYIVGVPISKDDYPQKVFESINATGAKLTASDLIRNYILMPIESDRQEQYYDNYWKRIEKLVDSDSKKLEAFFRFFLIAKRQTAINKNAVYYSFTEWFEKNVETKTVEGIFKEIVEYADSYNRIYRAKLEALDRQLQPGIEEFRFILSEMPAPFLIEMFQLNKQGKVSTASLAEIIVILNSYLMRRQLCDLDTSGISRFFPTLLKETLADCAGDYTNIVEIFKKNLVNRNKGNAQEMPDDKKMKDRIYNANMYNLRLWLSIFLRKLENEDNPATVDLSKLSIEHLMPQTPTAEWYVELGCDKDTYERNVHRLGNLTLAAKPDNSRMGNHVWEYKNMVLANTSHIKINEEILEKEHWNLQEIEQRTEKLIEEMIRLYPYYEASEATIEKVPIYIEHPSGGKANAFYYPDNGSVEILQGSVLRYTEAPFNEIEDTVNALLEDETIGDLDGKLVFFENYVVYPRRSNGTGLSTAAAIIINFSCNGWEVWRTEDGRPIRESQNESED